MIEYVNYTQNHTNIHVLQWCALLVLRQVLTLYFLTYIVNHSALHIVHLWIQSRIRSRIRIPQTRCVQSNIVSGWHSSKSKVLLLHRPLGDGLLFCFVFSTKHTCNRDEWSSDRCTQSAECGYIMYAVNTYVGSIPLENIYIFGHKLIFLNIFDDMTHKYT